jgi:hypothetical protein
MTELTSVAASSSVIASPACAARCQVLARLAATSLQQVHHVTPRTSAYACSHLRPHLLQAILKTSCSQHAPARELRRVTRHAEQRPRWPCDGRGSASVETNSHSPLALDRPPELLHERPQLGRSRSAAAA